MPANKRRVHNKRHEEEIEVTDAMATMEEDAADVGMVAAGWEDGTMRPDKGLHGTTRDGGVSQQWVVVQQEDKADGEQTNEELG